MLRLRRSLTFGFILALCWVASPVESFFFLSALSSIKSGISSLTNNVQLMEVTPARVPADLDGIRECRQSAMDSTKSGPLLDMERRFLNADAVAEKKVQCIVAREKLYPWRVLGSADVRFSNSGDALVQNVYVREESRGQGLGKTLMRGVEELVRTTKDPTTASDAGLELSLSVYTRNRVAMNLYRRCGYEARGVHSVVSTVGESAGLNLMVTMKKDLSVS
jgi:GNAT superfamily N-acetyltransferase